MRKKYFHQNQSGMTLTEILVASALAMTIFTALIGFVSMAKSLKQKSDTSAGAVLIRDNLVSAINSPISWSATVGSNPSMNCLKNRQDCSSQIAGAEFELNDGLGNGAQSILTHLSSVPSAGFDRGGDICNTFNPNAGVGDSSCVFHYVLKWRPLCAPGSCVDPQVEITGDFSFNSSNEVKKADLSLSKKKYALKFIRGSAVEALPGQICSSFGGTLSGTNCILPMLGGSCPPGQAMIGIDSANNRICSLPTGIATSVVCAANEVFKGVDDSGSAVCVPKTCPPGSPGAGGGGGFGGAYSGKTTRTSGPPPSNIPEDPARTAFDAWADTPGGGDGGCGGSDGCY